MIRNQLNALHDPLVAAMAALDWSTGAPKLSDYQTITNPVVGNVAFDYINENLVIYAHGEWCTLAIG